jgi:hypothetical protein
MKRSRLDATAFRITVAILRLQRSLVGLVQGRFPGFYFRTFAAGKPIFDIGSLSPRS